MKRKNRVKKIVALMLALVLSVCQISVTSYAEDDAEQDGFISSEEVDSQGIDDDGFADEEEFSDETNLAEAKSPSRSTPETEATEETDDERSSDTLTTYAENPAGQALDLSDYLTDVNVNQPFEGGTFSIELGYMLNTRVLKEKGTNSLTYQLPVNISALDDYDGNIIDSTTKEKVGTYHIDSATGKATLLFDDTYVQAGSADTDIIGTLKLWAKANDNQTSEDGKITIDFGKDIKTTVTVKTGPPKQYNVDVEKECSGYHINKNADFSAASITYDYVIDISSTTGTKEDIQVKDMLDGLKSGDAEYRTISVKKYDKSGKEDTSYQYDGKLTVGSEGESGNLNFSGTLPKLEEGEKYRLTYSVTKKIKAGETTGYVANQASASNEYVNDVDENIKEESLWDLQIEKDKLDVKKDGDEITGTYSIKISTKAGTGKEISLDDYMKVLAGGKEADGIKREYTVTEVKKYSGNTKTADLTKDNKIQGDSSSGKLSGKLEGLKAGEYYIIKYTVKLSDLPADKSNVLTLQNTAKIEDEHNRSQDSTFDTVTRSDVSVKKSTGNPVTDPTANTISTTYQIKVSTKEGTAGIINLEDSLTLSTDKVKLENAVFTLGSIKKYGADGTVKDENVSSNLTFNKDGKMTGNLPQLSAGEYYVIEYTVTLKNMPADEKFTFTMYNTVNVRDGNNTGTGGTSTGVGWTGSKYGDWIHKTGSYDQNSGKIKWTITLNKYGYGDIDQKQLSDTLIFKKADQEAGKGKSISLAKADIKMYERAYDTNHQNYAEIGGPYKIQFPFTFTNGAVVKDSAGNSHKINTKNEFYIEYETTVGETGLPYVKNEYLNTAILGNEEDQADVVIKNPPKIEKSFVDSTPVTGGGYYLNWKTEIEVPGGNIAAGSYYTDSISDASTHQSNKKNWFTVDLLKKMKVTKGTQELTRGTDGQDDKADYYIAVTGYEQTGYDKATDIPLSSAGRLLNIISFKIVFKKDIKTEGNKIQIAYSSYASGNDMAHNTGSYTQEGENFSDRASGQGKIENLLEKKSLNGGTGVHPISALYNSVTGKYILTYKLDVNKSNTAKGDITITDQLPAGTKLVTVPWKANDGTQSDRDHNDFIDGVYVHYYKYDSHDYSGTGSPYTSTECIKATYNVKDPSQGIDINDCASNQFNAKDKGTKVELNSETNVLTINIPKGAYSGDFEIRGYHNGSGYPLLGYLRDVSFSMAIYYAVEISPENWESYEKTFENSCTLKVDNEERVTKSVTDTVETDKVAKKGTYDAASNTLSYELDINPQGTKLIEGQENKLSIVDSLIYDKRKLCQNHQNHENDQVHDAITQVALKPGSLKLYKVEKDGSEIEQTSDVIQDLKLETTEQSAYEGKMTISLKVPDGAHYRLKYSYMLTISIEAQACRMELKATNTASITGLASTGTSSSDEKKFSAQGSEATSTVNYTTAVLYKRDKENQAKTLSGAEFQLDKYNGTDWTTIGRFTTGDDGSVQLGELINNVYRIGYNCAYRLHEIKAPDGYKLLESDKYFWIPNSKFKTEIVPTDWKTNTLYTENRLDVLSGYIFVDDEKQDVEKTDFEVNKIWKNTDGELIRGEGSIEVTLYRTSSKDDMSNGSPVGTAVTLNDENSWHYVWADLEKYQSEGTPYYYYVKETLNSDSWEVSYSNKEALASDGENRSFIITNTSKEDSTSVKVRKVWEDENGSPLTAFPRDQVRVSLKRRYPVSESGATSNGIVVTVILKGKDYTNQNQVNTKTETITVPEGAKVVISAKSPYSNGFSGITSIAPMAAEVLYGNYGSYSFGSGNQYSGTIETLSFRAYRDTTVNIGNDVCVYDFTSFKAEEDTGAGIEGADGWVEDKNFEDTVELSGSNSWQYSWDLLAQTSPAGTPYYYYAVEETAVDGFKITYSYQAAAGETSGAQGVTGGDITVTNTKEQEKKKIQITVKKAWEGYDQNEYGSYEVQVQLFKDGVEDGSPVTLTGSGSNRWTYTWTDLEEGSVYSVQEKSVTVKDASGNIITIDNFNTTYTVTDGTDTSEDNRLSAAGTITITNTKKSQGILLPGTGGKDGWIFYGLGAGFWLISLSWLGLTFKKRNKLIKTAKEGRKGIP